MAMKDYSDEFKADAVALYESTPGALSKSIAADLGINRATLREWVLRDRERRGVTAAARSWWLIPIRLSCCGVDHCGSDGSSGWHHADR
ncbi:transposase [Streptomyces mirabilis]|uniref:transposase n=1 Tax=Streptomyces mirabilis TaxID=68239 RepID=UPI0036DC2264